ERLLQNSPELEKLTVVEFLDKYLKSQGFNVNKCWRSKDGASWNNCCVLSALLLSCADGASSDSDLAYSGNIPGP
ncbi:unnamed protein product, partial [Brassica oleracea]